jgi:hypothetical protein
MVVRRWNSVNAATSITTGTTLLFLARHRVQRTLNHSGGGWGAGGTCDKDKVDRRQEEASGNCPIAS